VPTKADLERDLAMMREVAYARAQLVAALAEFARLPLPKDDQWGQYHYEARNRLRYVASMLADAMSYTSRPLLTVAVAQVRARIDGGISYEPHPGALPKEQLIGPAPDQIVFEGGAQ
jgi:hypothetical protein